MERKMTIEEAGIYREDYQIRMFRDNRIEGLLPVKGRGADGNSFYDYDVSGKISVKALYERNPISGEDIKAFLKRLLAVLRETEKYLLNIHRILLEPEYIYYDNGEYFFCYYPPGAGNLWEALHSLTEYFAKQADYNDQECVRIIFLLHKTTMEENYSLEKLVKECLHEEKEKKEKEKKMRIEEKDRSGMIREERKAWDDEPGGLYGEAERDRITEREMGGSIREESGGAWVSMKQFLGRHRKPKWGNWDGLYIEEEELWGDR